MQLLVKLSLVASGLALLAAPAAAQMTMSKGAAHQPASKTQAMMTDCSAMMQEVMADPIVRKRMMAIMQKHMRQHAGHNGMMMSGMSGGSAMQGGNASSDSASHEAHHTTVPLATPTSSSRPTAVPSP